MTKNFLKNYERICGKILISLAFVISFSSFAYTQTRQTPQPPVATPPAKRPSREMPRRAVNSEMIPAEKIIAAAENTNISICVNEGNVKINGWDRKEIRAMIEDGTPVGFKVLKRNEQREPVWLKIVGFDPETAGQDVFDECLSGREIQLDVPRGAALAIKNGFGGVFDAQVDSVAKVTVKNINGSLAFDNIKKGIDADTLAGNIRIQNSSGALKATTMSGGILIFNSHPADVTDSLFVRTISGSVNLQEVSHSQIEVSSTSGSINFAGSVSSGGQYSFWTNTGSIILNIPPTSSFSVNAIYGSGNFKSQFALENLVKTSDNFQRITGKFGQGDASLNIKTFSGSVLINRSNK